MTAVNIAASALFTAALFASYLAFNSQIALAQAADSLMDVLSAAVLMFAVGMA